MKLNKKLLSIGLLSVSVIPLSIVSCSTNEEYVPETQFDAEGFRISSEGWIIGFSDSTTQHIGKLTIKDKYMDEENQKEVKITSIGYRAFKDQTGITELDLPATLEYISSEAFYNIGSPFKLPDQYTPDPIVWDLSHLVNLKQIAPSAFGKLEPPIPNPNDPPVKTWSIKLNLSNLNNLILIGSQAFEFNDIVDITFPASSKFTTIESFAFRHNKLTSLILPDSITSIGNWAFEDNKLTSVTISNSATEIGIRAFRNNKITSLTIPNSVTTIEYDAFYNNQLTLINIPDSVTHIGDDAFSGNNITNNSQITLPAKFNTLEERQRIGINIPPNLPIKNTQIDAIEITSSRRKNEIK
ncbi:MAG: leucine-rich repeat domain-containing protein [Metamycoplasmataceae bacterium]